MRSLLRNRPDCWSLQPSSCKWTWKAPTQCASFLCHEKCSGRVHQHGKNILFVGGVVMELGTEIEVSCMGLRYALWPGKLSGLHQMSTRKKGRQSFLSVPTVNWTLFKWSRNSNNLPDPSDQTTNMSTSGETTRRACGSLPPEPPLQYSPWIRRSDWRKWQTRNHTVGLFVEMNTEIQKKKSGHAAWISGSLHQQWRLKRRKASLVSTSVERHDIKLTKKSWGPAPRQMILWTGSTEFFASCGKFHRRPSSRLAIRRASDRYMPHWCSRQT